MGALFHYGMRALLVLYMIKYLLAPQRRPGAGLALSEAHLNSCSPTGDATLACTSMAYTGWFI
jgi:hypothetical protein